MLTRPAPITPAPITPDYYDPPMPQTSPNPPPSNPPSNFATNVLSAAGVVGLGAAACSLMFLKVAKPHEILVKTGFLVKGKRFGSSMVVLPHLQQHSIINMTARIAPGLTDGIYTEESHTIKVKWIATYQPSHDPTHLALYVDRLNSMGSTHAEVGSTGELISERIGAALRGIAARNKLANINSERASFAEEIQDLLCSDLLQTYGITVKFNIDSVDSTATASTSIRVETAKQEAAQRTSELKRETAVVTAKQQRLEAEASAELDIRRAELSLRVGMEQAQAKAGVQLKTAELTADVERANIETRTQTLRAEKMAEANVAAEVKLREADATASAIEMAAKAELFQNMKRAEGIRLVGQAEADVARERAKAEADGVRLLVDALGGDAKQALGLRMISSGQLTSIAQSHTDMLSKANLYFTGGSGKDALSSISALAPSVDLLHRHGYELPGWLLPKKKQESSESEEGLVGEIKERHNADGSKKGPGAQ